jgi:hypothetical protein
MIGLVHLVWAPLGIEPVRRFLDSYRARAAGAPHELIIALNGLQADGAPAGFRDELADQLRDLPHRLSTIERPALDLAVYGQLAQELEHERLCMLNSYSVILADGWLRALDAALDLPGVGLAGVSGSWESQSEWRRGRLRWWPYQLARLPLDRRTYPRFPNPHIRTTGFIAERDRLAACALERADSKGAAYRLESGQRSLTREMLAAGSSAVVVGRDGGVYESDAWAGSATYRAGAQRNLLISDNRTREWDAASEALKRRLTRDAWGSLGSV